MTIGFIGLGTMGTHFASNLLKAGHALVVHDLNRDHASPHLAAGAVWADSPRALAEQCDVIMTSLPGPPEFEALVMEPTTGLLAGMNEGNILFDLSTNSPTLLRRLDADFRSRGVHLFDAPVSGGPSGAESGRLAIWVGGDEAVFTANRSSLDSIGDQVRYIGDIGAGTVAKLVHNASAYVIQAALAEVFSVGVKAGVEPLALFEAVRQGARGRQRSFDMLAEHLLINDYDPAKFALRLAHKDVSLARDLGLDVEVPTPMIDYTVDEMGQGIERGWGHRDSRVSMLLQLERAGLDPIEVDRASVEAVKNKD